MMEERSESTTLMSSTITIPAMTSFSGVAIVSFNLEAMISNQLVETSVGPEVEMMTSN